MSFEGAYLTITTFRRVVHIYALHSVHYQRVDVVAQSAGAIAALLAARIAPERFRSIVLVDPAGLQRTVTRDHCDLFLSVRGEHHELYMQPEKYAGAAAIALEMLARLN